ncbi:DNA-formamidopyrimidine glycosylase family protein [Segetibacter koreensis]|uniref:DNA-formamidopyrimidine glycosylase family protein n=1 Tax=Segetibacter koreensis TaxID=398037 RepID=UPI00035DA7D3|nr:DNA-formamidopyrimidine glycosylase family protein [Segetibacter koreensis]
MPEIPDIEVFAYNLKQKLAGKKLVKVEVVNGKKLKDTPEEISSALEGKTLKDIYRSGKEFPFVFSDETVLGMHLMLTGDIMALSRL